ncbi:MAG: histidine phosphatase family protein [Oscillospiraceae bacterium]|nr:histidine phosphatase family protein [Oscillospiraceae bacterium]
MRKLYLVRHGEPNFPAGKRMCLGSTDLPLSPLGRMQSVLAGAALENKALSGCYCSPLKRSRETAEYINAPLSCAEGLEEMHAGEWDGLDFETIRARWPEIYEARGNNLSLQPPGAEPLEAGAERFERAVAGIIAASEGDICVVAHASVEKAFLAPLLGLSLERSRTLDIRYGSISELAIEDGKISVVSAGELPRPELGERLCFRLLEAYGAPEKTARHSIAVLKKALELTEALQEAGVELDTKLLLSAALLHDIARAGEDHEAEGARLLRALGYPEVAALIAVHHGAFESFDEAFALALADRLIFEEAPVTLRERFEISQKKCHTPEALAAHESRRIAAFEAARRLNALCGREAATI